MKETIKAKLFSLTTLIVLITAISISIPYFYMTKQDKKSDSKIRIAVAFDIISEDIEKIIQDKSQRIEELLQQVSAIPWELTWYEEHQDKAEFFLSATYSSYITTIGEEFTQFSNFISADRLFLYTADKRLLISYHLENDEENVEVYAVNKNNKNTFLSVNNYSRLLIRGESLPEVPIRTNVNDYLNRELPDNVISEHFLDNGQLGLRIISPVYNHSKKVGTIVAETYYTQSMAEKYAELSQSDVNFFANQQLFIGTLKSQRNLESSSTSSTSNLLNSIQSNSDNNDIASISLEQHDYYQGIRYLTDSNDNAVGSITVSLSQDIEKNKIKLILQTVLLVSLFSIAFVFGLTVLLSRKTLLSIKDLTTSASEIADGNIEYPICITGKDELGILARSFSIMRDAVKTQITELKSEIAKHELTNVELQESENKYRTLFEKSADAILIIENNKFVDCNDATVTMLGYKRKDELLEAHPSELSPEVQVDGESSFEKMNKMMSLAFELGSYRFEWDCQRLSGEVFPVETLFTAVHYGERKFLHVVWRDITERKLASEQLSYQASHDALTGLVNRREFERRAESLLLTTKEDKSHHALCYMDLDQFKVVNDTCGHTAGDELLRQLSKLLLHTVRERDTLARLGGDEFGVLMEHCSIENANRVATTLLKAIQNYQFVWEGHRFKIGVSMGLVPMSETTSTLTELLKDADAACYMAKDQGRNRIHAYHADDLEMAKRHGEMQWVERIHQALEENLFCLYAQSIIPLDGSTDTHYELLIRMIDAKGKIIPPDAFLPAAERYNLISKIDQWVIKRAFTLLKNNPNFLDKVNFCSINLSGQSLTEPDILTFIIAQLERTEIDGNKICFEITETAAISNLKDATTFISTLKDLGCRFALDDFGSGFSSFAYLKNLPVDYLKIDGMFVKDIIDDPIDHAMVKSINEIGHVMDMQTIAEFVENDAIKGILNDMGVDYAQGYGIDKPHPFDELLD